MYPTLEHLTADTLLPSRRRTRFQVYPAVKRGLDATVAMLLLAPCALLIGCLAVAIVATEGGPVFFVQDRIGRGGKTFRMYKLRTMRPLQERVMHATLKDDARITALGSFLRRSHLDELPQLFNILAGHMSLIGPRPEQPHLVEYYARHIPGFDARHMVRPGLSGLAQVAFGYATDLEETRQKFRYDLYYVMHCGPSLDLKICWKTIEVYANPKFVR